ncbi:MAG: DUF2306 domain-containing protein [Pseudomonadota bacterium]
MFGKIFPEQLHGHRMALVPQMSSRTEREKPSLSLLRISGRFWFIIFLAGQLAFFYYLVSFYGLPLVVGDISTWNSNPLLRSRPSVPGESFSTAMFGMHALGATIIAFGGGLQLIPIVRRKAPTFHRWNGRVFLVTVTALSLTGLYLVWVRGPIPVPIYDSPLSVNGLLILSFSALTVKHAISRKIDVHERWAMRLLLVANAQWFLRIGVFGYLATSQMTGRQPSFEEDPFIQFWQWGCFLMPLAGLQIYWWAGNYGNAFVQRLTAASIVLVTAVMGAGIFAYAQVSQSIIENALVS